MRDLNVGKLMLFQYTIHIQELALNAITPRGVVLII